MTSQEKVEVVAELKDLVSGKMQEITNQVNRLEGALAKAGRQGDSSGGIMKGVIGANLLTGALRQGVGAMVDFGKESFHAFGRMEQLQTSLTTMFHGNREEAKGLINEWMGFAKETPFEMEDIAEAGRMLIAYGSNSSSVTEEMRVLGDISSGVGSSLKDVAYLYGTVRTQGKANLIDLRQFANRGIPIFNELSKVTKYTMKELVAGGKDVVVTFKDVENAFANMTKEGGQFHDMMRAQSQTLLGQTSNLSDAWTQLQAAIGESQSGILKDTIAWATSMVSEMGRVQQASNFRNAATKPLGSVGEYSSKFGYDRDQRDEMFALRDVTGKTIETSKDAKMLMEKLAKSGGMGDVTQIYGEDRLKQYSDNIFNMVQNTKKEDQQNTLNAFTDMYRDLKKQMQTGEISPKLAANEMAVLNAAITQITALKNAGKKNPTLAEGGEKGPSELEKVAAANRPTQVNIHIENLVRDLRTIMPAGTPEMTMQKMAEMVARVLLGAVNDISVLEHQ